MKINTKYLFPIFIITGLLACDSNLKTDSNNNSNEIENEELNAEKTQFYHLQDDIYIGDYLTQDEACNVKITIEKNEGYYNYHVSTSTLKNSGNLNIDSSENNVYFLFTNWISPSNESPIQAILNENELMIQNYGNSMNSYHHVKDCDVKYIQLIKEK